MFQTTSRQDILNANATFGALPGTQPEATRFPTILIGKLILKMGVGVPPPTRPIRKSLFNRIIRRIT